MNWLITVVVLAIIIGGIWYLLDDDGDLAIDITPNPTATVTATPTSTPSATVTTSPVATATPAPAPGQGGEDFNFLRTGTLVRNINGIPANTWYIRYDTAARAGVLARVTFNSESTCWVNGSFMACNSAPLASGMAVRIEGNLNTAGEDTLEVHELRVVSTSTPAPSPTPTVSPTPFPVSPTYPAIPL